MWRSGSTAGAFVDLTRAIEPGQVVYGEQITEKSEPLVAVWRGLRWQFENGVEQPLMFAVAASRAPSLQSLQRLRRNLAVGSAAFATLLLGVLLWVTRSTTRPLRQLEAEIAAVEAGQRQKLSGGFPREVSGVVSGLNTLLEGERKRIARYRNSLADLAHSLKTPLAVIRSVLRQDEGGETSRVVNGEVDRMTALIDRYLKRAALSGGVTLGQAPVEIAPLLGDLRLALLRAYAHKDLLIEIAPVGSACFQGDRTDLLEMVGNILDNACKWCRSRVRVTLTESAASLRLTVEDDGPGLAPALLESGPARGQRADEATPGHGIGLAMVRETAESYGGQLELARSLLGGAMVSISVPRASAAGPRHL
jgi:two-component system sensor histidine kinase PhoQ